MPAKKTKKEEISFEEALERINEISEKLSGNSLGLDESVELYAEGMKLIAQCKEKLDSAERKIHLVSDKKTNKTTEYTIDEE